MREMIMIKITNNGFQDPGNLLAHLDDTFSFANPGNPAEKLVCEVFERYREVSGLTLRPEKTGRCPPSEAREEGTDLSGTRSRKS